MWYYDLPVCLYSPEVRCYDLPVCLYSPEVWCYDLPVCLYSPEVRCYDLPVWQGLETNSTDTRPGAVANTTCGAGHAFVDHADQDFHITKCSELGYWQPALPTCQREFIY